MVEALKKVPFKPADIALFQDFRCGDEPWEQEVARWIKNDMDDGVLSALQEGCEVWVYYVGAGDIVGFGSLDQAAWGWPKSSSKRVPINLIPWLGIDQRFWGHPLDAGREDRYSRQLLKDLIAEASTHSDRHPVLGLCVDHRNVRAINLYKQERFEPFGKDYVDPNSGTHYMRMLRDLA